MTSNLPLCDSICTSLNEELIITKMKSRNLTRVYSDKDIEDGEGWFFFFVFFEVLFMEFCCIIGVVSFYLLCKSFLNHKPHVLLEEFR